MLAETTRLLRGANIDRFEAATADAGEFPLDGSYPDKQDHDSSSAAYRSLSHQSTACSVRLLPA
jgi:hypothetical protein